MVCKRVVNSILSGGETAYMFIAITGGETAADASSARLWLLYDVYMMSGLAGCVFLAGEVSQ